MRVEIADLVATVTLDMPPVNAQNRKFREEVQPLFDSFSDRNDVRCIVLTGAGRAFSAGADIKERRGMADEPGAYWAHNRRTREGFYAVEECTKPVIAAINGVALGAGFGLAASCDIMLASEDAVIGMPEIDVGLMGGCKLLQKFFPHSRARRMMFTGERLGAADLLRFNVVDQVFPRDELLAGAMALAKTIASKSPIAMKMAKHSFLTVENMQFKDGYRFEQNLTVQLGKTEDAKEAQRAFAEKRNPVFQGR
jgi:enoyl-CoA hydratase